jgi:hypothetical protein
MRLRVRENAVPIALAAVGITVVGWLTLYGWALTDYDFEARPALDALVHGHALRFFQLAPAYGGSLEIRAPFALATRLWGGGELSIYRAAAAPCLLASAVLAVWLVARMRTMGHAPIARGIALALCVVNPLTLSSLEIGHPEELLGAVLCVAAVVVAMRSRPIWAGVLLGLAIANKEWALVAVGPVAIALPDRRIIALLAAGAAATAVLAPLTLAGHFVAQANGAATQATVIFNPWQLWWFLGRHVHTLRDAAGHVIPGHRWNHRVEPSWVGVISHPLIVAVTLPLTLACMRLRRRDAPRPASEALVLLMLVLLLRCMLDPWDISYYAIPFLIALVVWESLTLVRPPVLALVGSIAAWFAFQWAVPGHGFSPDVQAVLFLGFSLGALTAIVCTLYFPGLGERLSVAWRRRAVAPTPA